MLSKSKGQILRVAAALNELFHLDDLPLNGEAREISDGVITAAISLVEICCQQAAYIAGRGDIKEEIDVIQASKRSTAPINRWCSLYISNHHFLDLLLVCS